MSDKAHSLSDDDLEILLVCSFRYALGRRTYMPSVVQSLIKQNKHVLKPGMCSQLIREIQEHYRLVGNLGDTFDTRDWLVFADWLKDNINES